MDDYSRRREVLVRIAELLEQMPEDVLLQLIQRWETELSEILEGDMSEGIAQTIYLFFIVVVDKPERNKSDRVLF